MASDGDERAHSLRTTLATQVLTGASTYTGSTTIASGILTPKLVPEIVRCAKVTARLYALQLEEIGNF